MSFYRLIVQLSYVLKSQEMEKKIRIKCKDCSDGMKLLGMVLCIQLMCESETGSWSW